MLAYLRISGRRSKYRQSRYFIRVENCPSRSCRHLSDDSPNAYDLIDATGALPVLCPDLLSPTYVNEFSYTSHNFHHPQLACYSINPKEYQSRFSPLIKTNLS